MTRTTTKVAVSIPTDLYRAVERRRKGSGRTRSSIIQEALRSWIQQQELAVLVRQYVEGYRKKPETRREVTRAEATGMRLLASQEW